MSEKRGSGKQKAASTRRSGAELAAPGDLRAARTRWVIAIVEGFHYDQPGALGGRRHPLGFGRIGGEGFLTQDVFAGLERLQRPCRVQPVRQRL